MPAGRTCHLFAHLGFLVSGSKATTRPSVSDLVTLVTRSSSQRGNRSCPASRTSSSAGPSCGSGPPGRAAFWWTALRQMMGRRCTPSCSTYAGPHAVLLTHDPVPIQHVIYTQLF